MKNSIKKNNQEVTVRCLAQDFNNIWDYATRSHFIKSFKFLIKNSYNQVEFICYVDWEKDNLTKEQFDERIINALADEVDTPLKKDPFENWKGTSKLIEETKSCEIKLINDHPTFDIPEETLNEIKAIHNTGTELIKMRKDVVTLTCRLLVELKPGLGNFLLEQYNFIANQSESWSTLFEYALDIHCSNNESCESTND